MEDTSFVSFVSSCLLEPEREAFANKMNEDDDLSHLNEEAFLDFLSFPQDILIPLRDRAFSWDVSLEDGLHADLIPPAPIDTSGLLVRHANVAVGSKEPNKVSEQVNMSNNHPAGHKVDGIKVEADSIFDADVSELFDESLLHPNLIDPINNPLPDVMRSDSTTSSGNKPKITIKFNDKLLKQETDNTKAADMQSQQQQQQQHHSQHQTLAHTTHQSIYMVDKLNTSTSDHHNHHNNNLLNHEGKRVIQSPHMVNMANLGGASSSSGHVSSSSSSGPVSTYMNHSLNKVASTSALHEYGQHHNHHNGVYSSSSSSGPNSMPSLKRSLSVPSGKDMLDGHGNLRPIGSYHYNDMLSINNNNTNNNNNSAQNNNNNGSPNFDNNSYMLMNGPGNNSNHNHHHHNHSQMGSERRVGAYTIEERRLKIEKFRERKRARIWRKQIKYDCRKRLADTRPRVKGRFVSRKNMTKEELEMLLAAEKEGEGCDEESVGSHSMEPDHSMMDVASPEGMQPSHAPHAEEEVTISSVVDAALEGDLLLLDPR